MPDRHRLHVRQVDLGLDGEEAVDLPLGCELGCELLEVDGFGARIDLHCKLILDDVFKKRLQNIFR